MSNPGTEFIYFDLGNVLISFDHSRAFNQISMLTGISPAHVEQVLFGGDLQARYEKGEVSTTEFHQYFCEQAGVDISLDSLCAAASDIFEPFDYSIELLRTLGQAGHRIGLLSNTCDCHWRFIMDDARFRFLEASLELMVLSYVEGHAKPEKEIYRIAVKRAKCDPGSILFIDDLPEHITAARSIGMDGVHFQGISMLVDELTSRGLVQ